MAEKNWLNNLMAGAHGNLIVRNKRIKMNFMKAIENFTIQVIIKNIVIICSVFFSIHLNAQERLSMEMKYDKTGQLIFENMEGYYYSSFFYDKTGNRQRKVSFSQISGISTKEEQTSNIHVYPNPVAENLRLEFTLQETGTIHISIFSVDGKKLSSERIVVHEKSGSYTLDLSGYASGTYLLELKGESFNHSGVIVVK